VQDGLCRRETCSSSLGDHVQLCGQVAGIELKKSATSSTRDIRNVFGEVGWDLGNSLGQSFLCRQATDKRAGLGFRLGRVKAHRSFQARSGLTT
jgi:hypothetical protein